MPPQLSVSTKSCPTRNVASVALCLYRRSTLSLIGRKAVSELVMARTLLPMATERDDDSPAKNWRKTIITSAGVILALFSLATLGLSSDVRQLRLAVVGALWAFLLVAVTNLPRRAQETVHQEDEEELKRFYQLELDQEVAARREYELRLEVQLRRELDQNRSADLEKIRTDLVQLRTDINGTAQPRPVQRPAIPAGGSIRSLPAGPSSRNEVTARPNLPTPLPHSGARPRQNPAAPANSPASAGSSASSGQSAAATGLGRPPAHTAMPNIRYGNELDQLAKAESWPDAFNSDRKALVAGPTIDAGARPVTAQPAAITPVPPPTLSSNTANPSITSDAISNTGRHHHNAALPAPPTRSAEIAPKPGRNISTPTPAGTANMAMRDDLSDILDRW